MIVPVVPTLNELLNEMQQLEETLDKNVIRAARIFTRNEYDAEKKEIKYDYLQALPESSED